MTDPASQAFNALFRPSSIAVVGGSESINKPGGKLLANIIDHGYEGTLRVVNPGTESVSGVTSFKTIKDLPEAPELAIIAIPASLVLSALEELAQIGTKAAIILTSGFGEKNDEGRREERRMSEIADRAGMILIGPNCSGFLTPYYNGKFAGIVPRPKPGSIDFISGSGAVVDLVMEQAVYRGLSFCNVVNLGNSAQTGVEDLLALYDINYGTESAPILLLYLEVLKKPLILLKHARQLTQKGCTIVGIKSGVIGAGARAAASHTGALTTDDRAVEALFKQAGIIRVKSKIEMIDVACVLSALGDRALSGNRVCVVSDAGGPGVMISDELERQGLALPVLNNRTRERLEMILPPESSLLNPVDCLPTRTAVQIREVLRIIGEEERDTIDLMVVMIANPGLSDNAPVYREVSRSMDSSVVPIIPVLNSTTTCAGLIQEFASEGKCYFQDEVPLGVALGKVVRRPRIHTP